MKHSKVGDVVDPEIMRTAANSYLKVMTIHLIK